MKYLITFCVLLILGTSCKSKVANPETGNTFKDVDIVEANAMIVQNKDLIILDVRTPKETALGIIPNAIIIDYHNSNFDTEINKLDKSKPYLIYCRSGGRSVGASNKMIATGFKDITNMKGGYTAWAK